MSASLAYEQWFNHIRTHSAFYNTQLSHLPVQGCDFGQWPIVDVNEYWKGSHDLDTWRVLTDKVRDALVFKTGGTTSQGKMSVYTHAEWQMMLDCFGRGLSAQLVAGDRIANLFFFRRPVRQFPVYSRRPLQLECTYHRVPLHRVGKT